MCGRRETQRHFVGHCPCASMARAHISRILREYEETEVGPRDELCRILGPRSEDGPLPDDHRELTLHAHLVHSFKSVRNEVSFRRQRAIRDLGQGWGRMGRCWALQPKVVCERGAPGFLAFRQEAHKLITTEGKGGVSGQRSNVGKTWSGGVVERESWCGVW